MSKTFEHPHQTGSGVSQGATSKQQAIQYLTDLMGTLQAAYFKGHLGERNTDDCGGDGCITGTGLWIHECYGNTAAISIDLYDFGGTGQPVCDGLRPCTLTYDDGSQDNGWLFCMHYDPEDVTPLQFILSHEEGDDGIGDIDVSPETLHLSTIQAITKWLESLFTPKH